MFLLDFVIRFLAILIDDFSKESVANDNVSVNISTTCCESFSYSWDTFPKAMLLLRWHVSIAHRYDRKETFVRNLFAFPSWMGACKENHRSNFALYSKSLFAYLMKIDKITHRGAYCFFLLALYTNLSRIFIWLFFNEVINGQFSFLQFFLENNWIIRK